MNPGLLAIRKRASAVSPDTWRYWRIYVTANNGDTYCVVGYTSGQYGFILAATAGGATVLTSSMAYTSETAVYPGDTFASVCTSLLGTWLSNGQAGPWSAHVDLGTAMTLVECRMYAENASVGPARAPNTFQIQGSSDGVNWTVVKSFSGINNWVAGQSLSFSLV